MKRPKISWTVALNATVIIGTLVARKFGLGFTSEEIATLAILLLSVLNLMTEGGILEKEGEQ